MSSLSKQSTHLQRTKKLSWSKFMTSFKSLSDKEFTALFYDFQTSAFRLETLQLYAVDYEEIPFKDFMQGKERYTHAVQSEYIDMVSKHVNSGRSMSRVHIISEPLSDYVRFEILWPYADNVQAGEDVRLLPIKQNNWPENIPKEDFWIFDSKLVAVMNYDHEGRFLEAKLLHESHDIEKYLEIEESAVRSSIPYDVYVRNIK